MVDNYYPRLRDLREDHDLSQQQVADYLGMKQPQYSRYERGVQTMGIDKYVALSEYYNISLDYLCGLIDRPRKLRK